jgi:hypothetical protein
MRVMLAVPCRTDEPALGRTLELAWASWCDVASGRARGLDLFVCLNGPGAGAAALEQLRAFVRARGTALIEIDADRGQAAPLADAPLVAAVWRTQRAGKAAAWTLLRQRGRAPQALFLDADVSFGRDAFGCLLAGLDAVPGAALASARTACAPRATTFERIMAAPYGVEFPNLSPQLYAARVAALPSSMPDDLIEPERWLELVLGPSRVVRLPSIEVVVRLPGTLADFFRQRVRIEMGKVQLAAEYPGLSARSARQPGARGALARLGPRALARLAGYLALRSAARVVAEWRYRRGCTAGVWRQAGTTKEWDGA